MLRPDKPNPYTFGIIRSPNNRFEWNFGKIPTPQRSVSVLNPNDPDTGGRHVLEAVPLLCDWCGHPFWPPWQVIRGWCSDACKAAEAAYQAERLSKSELMDAVESAFTAQDPVSRLKELLKEIEQRVAEEDAAAAATAGAAGKGVYY